MSDEPAKYYTSPSSGTVISETWKAWKASQPTPPTPAGAETETPTPLTDAEECQSSRYDGEEIPGFDFVSSKFARQLERELTSLRRQAEADRAENIELRIMCAVSHCGSALYHDDGEIQDSREYPWIDWKRDSVTEIQRKLTERALPKIAALQPSPSLDHGATGETP